MKTRSGGRRSPLPPPPKSKIAKKAPARSRKKDPRFGLEAGDRIAVRFNLSRLGFCVPHWCLATVLPDPEDNHLENGQILRIIEYDEIPHIHPKHRERVYFVSANELRHENPVPPSQFNLRWQRRKRKTPPFAPALAPLITPAPDIVVARTIVPPNKQQHSLPPNPPPLRVEHGTPTPTSKKTLAVNSHPVTLVTPVSAAATGSDRTAPSPPPSPLNGGIPTSASHTPPVYSSHPVASSTFWRPRNILTKANDIDFKPPPILSSPASLIHGMSPSEIKQN